MRQKFLRRLQADALDLTKLRCKGPDAPASAVEIDGEAMALITDLLNKAQHGRTTVEDHGLILTAGDVNNLFSFGNARQLLIDNIEFVERRLRRVQLADTSVDKN